MNYGKERAPLWDSCKRELRAFCGLLPLLQTSWSTPWSPACYCFDSSLYGLGVCRGWRDPGQLRGLGRIRERDRFRKESSTGAREHAFAEGRGPFYDETEGLWIGTSWASEEAGFSWALNDEFPEVPEEIFGGEWEEVGKGPWRIAEPITRLETRALLRCLQRAIAAGDAAGRHLLILGGQSCVRALC